MTKEDILDYLKTHKTELQKKYHIEKIAIFGSYARDEATKESDIDILYSLKDGFSFTFDQYLELEERLKKVFGTKVELINSKKLNPLVKLRSSKEFIYV